MAIGIGMGIRVETDTGYVHRKSRVGITNFFPRNSRSQTARFGKLANFMAVCTGNEMVLNYHSDSKVS